MTRRRWGLAAIAPLLLACAGCDDTWAHVERRLASARHGRFTKVAMGYLDAAARGDTTMIRRYATGDAAIAWALAEGARDSDALAAAAQAAWPLRSTARGDTVTVTYRAAMQAGLVCSALPPDGALRDTVRGRVELTFVPSPTPGAVTAARWIDCP